MGKMFPNIRDREKKRSFCSGRWGYKTFFISLWSFGNVLPKPEPHFHQSFSRVCFSKQLSYQVLTSSVSDSLFIFSFSFQTPSFLFLFFFPLVFLLHLCLTVVFTSSLWLWIFLASIFPHYFSCVFPYFLTFANFRIFPHTTFIPIYCIQFSFRLRYYFINRLYLPLVFFPFIFFFIYLFLPLPRLMIITISIWIQFFLLTFFSFRSLRLVFVFPKNQFCLYFISGV